MQFGMVARGTEFKFWTIHWSHKTVSHALDKNPSHLPILSHQSKFYPPCRYLHLDEVVSQVGALESLGDARGYAGGSLTFWSRNFTFKF